MGMEVSLKAEQRLAVFASWMKARTSEADGLLAEGERLWAELGDEERELLGRIGHVAARVVMGVAMVRGVLTPADEYFAIGSLLSRALAPLFGEGDDELYSALQRAAAGLIGEWDELVRSHVTTAGDGVAN